MKRVLFATEFSDQAPHIFQYAAELAYRFKAQLLVTHAFKRPETPFLSDDSLENRTSRVLQKLIEFTTDHLPEAHREEVMIDYHALYSYPAEGILELALDQEVDLIVLGMTGKTDTLGRLMGSTAMDVLARADCQVLLVPQAGSYPGIRTIAYTLNFAFRDLEALYYLREWSDTFKAPIHAIHVLEPNEQEAAILKHMMILKETYKQTNNILFELRYGHFRDELEKYVQDKKIDLVAMISHKRNFISRIIDSSAVEGVVQRLSVPVLVIKEDAYQLDPSAWEWLEMLKGIG